MATYLTDPRMGIRGYSCTPDDGKALLRAGNGALHTQLLHEYTYFTITIPHPYITSLEFEALEAFCDEHGSDVQFTDPFSGIAYTGKLTQPPAETARRSATRCDAMMYFTGRAVADE